MHIVPQMYQIDTVSTNTYPNCGKQIAGCSLSRQKRQLFLKYLVNIFYQIIFVQYLMETR